VVSHVFPVALARGKHLFPFRTEKLSPSAPMVLGSQGPGRVGRRRFLYAHEPPQGAARGVTTAHSVLRDECPESQIRCVLSGWIVVIWGLTISVCVPVARGPISAGLRRDKAPGNASEFMTRDTRGSLTTPTCALHPRKTSPARRSRATLRRELARRQDIDRPALQKQRSLDAARPAGSAKPSGEGGCTRRILASD
jgi:hypothetical protein